MIKLKGVSKIYKLGGEEIRALDNASLNIQETEFLALVGPSGSGKSTLLHLLAGLDRPDKGKVIVGDLIISELHDKKLALYRRETIGFIFQTFHLISTYTAYENVGLPLQFTPLAGKEKKKRTFKALKVVGLENRCKHKPTQLSGGQQQRVAIARALVNQPKIILADEPTGNLDSKSGAEIVGFLKGLTKQDITVIMVTHDHEMAEKSDRVIKLRDGKL